MISTRDGIKSAASVTTEDFIYRSNRNTDITVEKLLIEKVETDYALGVSNITVWDKSFRNQVR